MNINTLKRVFRYITRGVPVEYITAEVKVNNNKRLEDKTILITGGAKGIGFAIAKKCIDEGAHVIICGRNENDLISSSKALGANCKYLQYDVANVSMMEDFLQNASKKMGGRINCLVNNAGVSYHEKSFREVTEEGFDTQFDINFKGAYFLAKYFVQYVESNAIENANILFISSERGSYCTDIPYGLSKATINSLVAALSNRLCLNSHIRVNALSPGVTVSSMTGRTADSNLSYGGNPLGRVFLPEEMAEVASFLLSDYSSCISGEVIHCDAGAHHKCI